MDGVYGPLYRLFEVSDEKFNIAVELTAGNRFVRAISFLHMFTYMMQLIPCGRRYGCYRVKSLRHNAQRKDWSCDLHASK